MTSTLQAQKVNQQSLPIIDIGALIDGDQKQRRTVAEQLSAACLDKGFFYIRNHGIEARLQARVFAAAKAFFEQPLATKNRSTKRFRPPTGVMNRCAARLWKRTRHRI